MLSLCVSSLLVCDLANDSRARIGLGLVCDLVNDSRARMFRLATIAFPSVHSQKHSPEAGILGQACCIIYDHNTKHAYVHVCACTSTQTQTQTQTLTHKHKHTCIDVYKYISTCTHAHTHAHAQAHGEKYVYRVCGIHIPNFEVAVSDCDHYLLT